MQPYHIVQFCWVFCNRYHLVANKVALLINSIPQAVIVAIPLQLMHHATGTRSIYKLKFVLLIQADIVQFVPKVVGPIAAPIAKPHIIGMIKTLL